MTQRLTSVSRIPILALLAAGLLLPAVLQAQTSAEVRDRLAGHFDTAMRKFMALAEAMPEEAYTWSPGEGVMEVGQVYMHVVHYNYMYPSQNLGFDPPAGVDLEILESVRDKEQIQEALEQSRVWVLERVNAMTAGDLESETQLYGQTVKKWAVLVQLVSHMSEHLGQSIAYARMNGIVPPWSR